MKQITLLTARLLVLTSLVIAAAGCQKPADRVAEPDKGIASGLVAVADLSEVVTDIEKAPEAASSADAAAAPQTATPPPAKVIERAVYVSDLNGTAHDNAKKLDALLVPKKISGKVDALIKKIVIEKNKTELTKHLATGAIALVILKDEIKVLKVVGDTHWNGGNMDTLKSMAYMKTLSAMNRSADAQQNSALAGQLSKLKEKQPADLKEKFGLQELTSIKISKMGVLENKRTDYGEKMSVLDIRATSLAEATHIVLGDEVGARASGEEAAP